MYYRSRKWGEKYLTFKIMFGIDTLCKCIFLPRLKQYFSLIYVLVCIRLSFIFFFSWVELIISRIETFLYFWNFAPYKLLLFSWEWKKWNNSWVVLRILRRGITEKIIFSLILFFFFTWMPSSPAVMRPWLKKLRSSNKI